MKLLLAPIFETEGRVLVAYLFGSHARGEARPLSDIDIAILLDAEPEEYLDLRLRLFGLLSDALRTDDIDLVLLNQASPSLKHRVFSEGKALFCRDDSRRVQFEVSSVLEYLDFAPYRERQKCRLLQRIREGRFGT